MLSIPSPLTSQKSPTQDRYHEWLNEVADLISAAERREFEAYGTDGARDHFVERFWRGRDPQPETPQNELRTERDQRGKCAEVEIDSPENLGLQSDREWIWRRFGPPDLRLVCPPFPGADSYAYELWTYKDLGGRGERVLEFVDPTLGGEYRLLPWQDLP